MLSAESYPLLKTRAVQLRLEGKTYSEILEAVPVAKSTLSLWLRSESLAEPQKQRITEKKRLSALRGAQKRKQERIDTTKTIFEKCRSDISLITLRELWLIGISLYWAEGSKQKEHNVGVAVCFSNTDLRMLQVFLAWLERCVEVPASDIHFELFLHETARKKLPEVQKYWKEGLRVRPDQRFAVYWKRTKIQTNRRNVGDLYYGCLRVRVKASSSLNRALAGWADAIAGAVTSENQ